MAADLAALARLARTAYAAALCEGHAARLRAAPPATPAPAPSPPRAPAPAPPPARAPAPGPPPAPAPAMEKFETYSWDQTDKFVTLYVPVEGATAAETTHDVGDRSFALAHARAGKTRRLAVSNLCGPVDAARSKLVLKRDRIQLRLAKAAPGDVERPGRHARPAEGGPRRPPGARRPQGRLHAAASRTRARTRATRARVAAGRRRRRADKRRGGQARSTGIKLHAQHAHRRAGWITRSVQRTPAEGPLTRKSGWPRHSRLGGAQHVAVRISNRRSRSH